MKRAVQFVVIAFLISCGGAPPTLRDPEAPAVPKHAPLPPEISADGVYVDPDAGFSIAFDPKAPLKQGSNGLVNMVGTDIDKGVAMVVFWKQPEPTATQLDGLLDTYTKAGAISSDVHVEGATLARGVKYAVHAPQPDAVGQAVAVSRPPWVIVVIVHARTGSPYEHRVSEVVDSFRLR